MGPGPCSLSEWREAPSHYQLSFPVMLPEPALSAWTPSPSMPPCLLAYGAPIHHFHSLCCLPAQAPATQATVVNTVAKDVLDGEPGWVVWIEGQTYGRMENRMHEGLRQHGGQKDSDTKGGVHTVCGLDPPGKDTQGPAASPTCRSRCSNSHPIQRRRPRKAKKGHQEVQLEASCPQEVTRTTPVSSMLSSRWPPAYASCLCACPGPKLSRNWAAPWRMPQVLAQLHKDAQKAWQLQCGGGRSTCRYSGTPGVMEEVMLGRVTDEGERQPI